jgi:hypothetical protein
MSLTDEIADGIIKKVHDVVPDNIEALIPDEVEGKFEGAIRDAVVAAEGKVEDVLPDGLEKAAGDLLPHA